MKTNLIAEGAKPKGHSLNRLLEDQCRRVLAEDSAAARRLKIDPACAAIHVAALPAQAMKGDGEGRGCGQPRRSDRTRRRELFVREDCETP